MSEADGSYHHDHRHNLLEWSLPVIDANNKSGSMEFSMAGHPDDFFPVSVSFISRKSYCEIVVSIALLMILKHLRQFVQSDWFLPVFISHDRDTAGGAPD